ncbi:ABC transporter permease [Inquilinus limosus]|uniref:ABC transporter permease n=1 Tax=Inquilinus limosus TaxID=171674 RepID=UPI003F1799BA
MTLLDVIALLDATIRTSTPLILAALAGLFAERAGLVDIGLEGKMLAAAFASAAMAAYAGSAWAGLGMGVVVSVALALLHGYASITHRGNQVVSGLAINIMASGLTVTLGIAWYQRGGQTPPLEGDARFQQIALPLADTLRDVPVIGPIWSELVSGHSILVYVAFLAVPLVAWIVYRTRFGLRLRAVGENPAAVDTAGISVAGLRYRAIALTGVLCGFAGTYLSVAQNASFGQDMTAGKGYLALAALIFAKWKPWPVMFTCLLFGLLEAIEARLQGTVIPGIGEIPVQFIQALPYILTVVLLAGFIGRATAPKASGIPYVKER